MDDEFMQLSEGNLPPSPSMDNGFGDNWIKYILEFHLPKDLENMLIQYLKPVVDLACKSNILRREIPNHLLAYDLVWDRYRIYMRQGRYEPRLLVVQEMIRHALELQLCRSVDGWQGNLIFIKKYDITQRNKERRIRGFLSRFRGERTEGQYEQEE